MTPSSAPTREELLSESASGGHPVAELDENAPSSPQNKQMHCGYIAGDVGGTKRPLAVKWRHDVRLDLFKKHCKCIGNK